ncbi:peptidase domain-containing ABC transporter [Butyricimonas virosa]|jgi:ATP-binding cassette, subfamily B, bacterial|uniref:peptidase domain-containing ABC transporter n=1 Tax=Butyricimonas virosa TaxID=544645 RepID=UPI0022E6B30B|nr:peptidase domain-containing ABC transporter [Butyricimonas virosa]
MKRFPFYRQLDSTDCGPTCLKIISEYYGKKLTSSFLINKIFVSQQGISMLSLKQAAESIGFETRARQVDWDFLIKHVKSPCIIHWNKNHFVIIYKIKKRVSKGKLNYTVYVCDPAFGKVKYSEKEFFEYWGISESDPKGFVLELKPNQQFYDMIVDRKERLRLRDFFSYLTPYYIGVFQFFLTMIWASVINLIFPFLTQAVVDIGIVDKNYNFIFVLLVAQLLITLGEVANDMIRSRLMLHITTRIGISFISDFLFKLVRLPISFFDMKRIGDIMQRINDNIRIQNFLTGTFISIIVALIIFIVYTIIMAKYNWGILFIFFSGSILYILWITFFLKKRRELDKKRFEVSTANQNKVIQLITGMQEIKLNGCEQKKLWEWENIQTKLYNIELNSLSLEQTQSLGGLFIDQMKNILISFLAARLVINGSMTLGMMMAMQYIIGQLNAPVSQFINFLGSTQDAKMSLERLGEIYNREDEESEEKPKNIEIPKNADIIFNNVVFQYEGPNSKRILDGLTMRIKTGKVNAIVGVSGSGKTTILKLLLGFYHPTEGEINLGNKNLNSYSDTAWRQQCGVVMQEGFIFSDSILQNIIIKDDKPNIQQFDYAVQVANLKSFIDSLPMGFHTIIGAEGNGISAGQRQRILIARAIYKNPSYIFMDEATNALDTTNEKIILENLNNFFTTRTVVIIAHRLSTIKNADNIIVINEGQVAESGKHNELIKQQGLYFNLVKDQIELNQ